MTKKGAFHSAEQYEEWARRMIHSVEDLEHAGDYFEWKEFCNNKLFEDKGFHATDAQLEALGDYRFDAYDMWADLDIKQEMPFISRPGQVRYRDLTTGRWSSKEAIKMDIGKLTGRIK